MIIFIGLVQARGQCYFVRASNFLRLLARRVSMKFGNNSYNYLFFIDSTIFIRKIFARAPGARVFSHPVFFRPPTFWFGVSVRLSVRPSVCPSYFFVRARTFERKVIETKL